jgi:hypothetical protein
VSTLCGQTLAGGTFAATDEPANCTNCIRRSRDQARISGAFFAQEEGSELLRLSLEQARGRKPALHVLPQPAAEKEREKGKPVVWPAPKPPEETVPERVGELLTRGFKPAGEGVWRSPAGVIVRMRRHGRPRSDQADWRFAEVVFEGEVMATRVDERVRLRAGDVEVVPTNDGYEVRLRKKS